MTLEWKDIDGKARHEDHAGLTALLLAATEEERLAFAPAVEAGVKSAAGNTFWPRQTTAGFILAVIATMPSAARAAALMTRRDLRDMWRHVPVPQFLRIAAAREVPWLGDLGVRLAHKLPARDTWATDDWRFTAAILAAGGAEPPVIEGVVRQWLRHLLRPGTREIPPLLGRMRDDPWLDLLVPALFAFDGMGADIGSGSWSEETQRYEEKPRVPGMIAALVAEGRLERKTILAATVDRLVRGDKPHSLRPFVMLHDALAPTVDEMAGHALDYARLLGEAPGAVAAVAQRCLRAVDDAGRLELETLLEASAPALVRPAKTLVKAQLTWLSSKVRDRPGEVCETIAVAFGHPALDVQERALTLVGKAVPGLDAAVVERLAEAGTMLAGDLPGRAATLFGAAVQTAPPMLTPLPGPVATALMPPPIADPAELAEEIAVLAHDPTAVRWERILAGIVALNAASYLEDLNPVIHTLAWPRVISVYERPPRQLRPTGVLLLRVHEIAVNLAARPVPMLVATPTHVNGSLDAPVLASRLARAEAEGRQPWPYDLEHALLRVPRDSDPAVAARLTSPAGRRFAAWLANGGLPDPVSERFEQVGRPHTYGEYTWGPTTARRVVAALRPARNDGLSLEPQLLVLNPPAEPQSTYFVAGSEDLLAIVLPHHREVAAAWAVSELAALADSDQRDAGRLLPLLADGSGPVGPAMAYGIAYTLGAKQEADRSAAVDTVLTLAAGAEPFAAAVGEALADLCSDGSVKLNRVITGLADIHRSGGSAVVWELIGAALPALLAAKVRAVPDLLELATQVAVTLQATDRITGLAEVATRPGGSRLVKEAKRLHTALSGPAPGFPA